MPRPRIELPRRERKYRFALTPLADAMFQLLIFFMLSSSLTPYSLLTVKSGAAPAETLGPGLAPADELPEPDPEAREALLWSLVPGGIVRSGIPIDFDDLPTVVDALARQEPVPAVSLLVGPEARVQDLSTVLAILRRSDIVDVALTRTEE